MPVTGKHVPNGLDEFVFRYEALRFGLLLQVLVAILDRGERRAKDEVLDLQRSLRLLVAALDDDARRRTPVGVFHLRLQAAIAEIKLGADARTPQLLHHGLIVGDAVAIEHEHDDRALACASLEFAKALKAEEEPRHADGNAGCRHLLAGEALDQPVITPAADDRAESHGLAAFVLDGSEKLGLEHR